MSFQDMKINGVEFSDLDDKSKNECIQYILDSIKELKKYMVVSFD